MNDEHSQESDELAGFEQSLHSLKPAELPAWLQVRIQFEAGRRQGRREGRRGMFALASAACLTVWAGTFWSERPEPVDSAPSFAGNQGPNGDLEPPASQVVWTPEDIRRIARYEAALRGRSLPKPAIAPDPEVPNSPAEPSVPWNRHRWMKELMTDAALLSG